MGLLRLSSRGCEGPQGPASAARPPPIGAALVETVRDPTRTPDSLPDGAPSEHFGRLQRDDAVRHARLIVDAIAAALV
jgi:hypothetical protein